MVDFLATLNFSLYWPVDWLLAFSRERGTEYHHPGNIAIIISEPSVDQDILKG